MVAKKTIEMVKNIALIIGQLSLGGSEKQLYLLAKHLNKSYNYNVSVIVLTSIIEPYGSMLKKEGVNVLSIKRKLPYFDIYRILALRKLIKENEINIIYSFSLTANYYTYFSSLKIKELILISGSRNIETDRSNLRKLIDDIIIRNSNALITNSNSNLDYIKKISIKPDSIIGYVIKNGIEIPEKIKLKVKKENKNITIGTIALFKKQKNYRLFIDLCAVITNEYKNINFIAIGDGPEFDKMVLYSKSKNLDKNNKIKFMGDQISATNIMSGKFDIFVLTSYKEGLPNAIMEAMSCGLPILATNVGGVNELVKHGKTGFLVPSNDLNVLVKYCKILIDSPKQRKEFGNRGLNFINDKFSSEKMVTEFKNIFDSLTVNKSV